MMAVSKISRILRKIRHVHQENGFRRCNWNSAQTAEQVENLASEISGITSEEVAFNPANMSDGAPVTYFPVYEGSDVTASIFALKDGASLPMHDHPDMFGFIRCVYGSLKISSYTKILHSDTIHPGDSRVYVKQESEKLIDTSSQTMVLTPERGNIHEIIAVNGPAAFLDFLTPPYADVERPCRFYQMESIKTLEGEKSITMTEIKCPASYWCASSDHHLLTDINFLLE